MMIEDVAADTVRRLRQIEGCGYPDARHGEDVLAESAPGEAPERLTADVVEFLRDLATYTAEHRFLTCDCPARALDHERRRAELMARKREILARIEGTTP